MVQLGVGTTSLTSGRYVPSLQLGYESKQLAVTLSSTGYHTRYDYMSAYIANVYKTFELAELWKTPATAGFGLGVYYSARGFRDTPESAIQETNDFGIGPAFYVALHPFDLFFLRIETLYAAGSGYNILLVFQDAAQITVGVSF